MAIRNRQPLPLILACCNMGMHTNLVKGLIRQNKQNIITHFYDLYNGILSCLLDFF